MTETTARDRLQLLIGGSLNVTRQQSDEWPKVYNEGYLDSNAQNAILALADQMVGYNTKRIQALGDS